jgi:S1-C subfamily serine protease
VGLPDVDGLLVREVEEGSPAAVAGLAQGDLITEAADQPARGIDDLFDALEATQRDAIDLKVVRGTEERTIRVVPAETSAAKPDNE